MAEFLLVDGYNMIFRAFYGMPELSRSDGLPTNAIHGFLRTLWWLEDHEQQAQTIVFMDLGGAQRQSAIREDYKANRGETPDALVPQIPFIKRLTQLMGVGPVEKEGVEADDLIGSWCKRFSEEGHQAKIVSADKDLAQCLIFDGVTQLLPPPTANPRLGWRPLDVAGVEKKFGVTPKQVPDYLALIGDTADNIPGIKGVGPKTAAKWLHQYGDIETIIAHCGELMPKRFQSLVHQEQENLRLNLQMTTLEHIHADMKLPDGVKDVQGLLDFFAELEMNKAVEDVRKRYLS
jgi:DNA polymerase-1